MTTATRIKFQFDGIKTQIQPAPDGLGNGLFTTSEVAPGEQVVLIKRPFVAVLDTPRLKDSCCGCFTIVDDTSVSSTNGQENEDWSSSLKTCTGCKVVKYCNKTGGTKLADGTKLAKKGCQSMDWKTGHSQECSVYKRLYPRILPNSVRAVLRIVMRHDRGKDDQAEWDAFLKLETHTSDIRSKNVEQWNRILLSAKAVKEYSGTLMQEESITYFFAALELNSFNLTSPFQDRIGLYLHPYAAMMNHSCDYNVVVGFNGSAMFVKPVRPLKKDEQLFLSYVDTTNPRDIRCQELQDRYYFDCNCTKCQLGNNTAEERYLIPNPNSVAVGSAQSRAVDLKRQASEKEPSVAILKLREALKVLQRTHVWPITRQPMASIRDELILTMLSKKYWHSAFAQSTLRFIKLDPILYPYDGHPLRHLHAFSLAKLATYLYEEKPPVKEDERISIYSLNLDLSLVIWALLTWIIDKQQLACTAAAFMETVTRIWLAFKDEFQIKGLYSHNLTAEAIKEWSKMEKIADSVLQQEIEDKDD